MMKKGLKIAIGADHAGFDLKQAILGMFDDINFKDFGTYSTESADYPDFAHLVANAVEAGEADFGFLLCGSANGVAMTANKHQGIRARIVLESRRNHPRTYPQRCKCTLYPGPPCIYCRG
jgi:ribose 5-phosphate isomerase B